MPPVFSSLAVPWKVWVPLLKHLSVHQRSSPTTKFWLYWFCCKKGIFKLAIGLWVYAVSTGFQIKVQVIYMSWKLRFQTVLNTWLATVFSQFFLYDEREGISLTRHVGKIIQTQTLTSQFEKSFAKGNDAKYIVSYSGWTEGLYQGPVKDQLNKDSFEL